MPGVLAVVVVVVTGARYRNDRTQQYYHYYYRDETKYWRKNMSVIGKKPMVVQEK